MQNRIIVGTFRLPRSNLHFSMHAHVEEHLSTRAFMSDPLPPTHFPHAGVLVFFSTQATYSSLQVGYKANTWTPNVRKRKVQNLQRERAHKALNFHTCRGPGTDVFNALARPFRQRCLPSCWRLRRDFGSKLAGHQKIAVKHFISSTTDIALAILLAATSTIGTCDRIRPVARMQ